MEEKQYVKYDFGKNCVCVGRVSTSIQSQTAQVRDLEEFAKDILHFEEIKTFFTTESGFLEQDDKVGWNLVTAFFDTHPDYRVLIVPEISRLSRKAHILHAIKDYLTAHKIQLIIKDLNFRLFDEYGKIPQGNDIVFALYASLAESEMRQKKERFARSLKDNRQMGYSIGGKELFGYTRKYETKDGKERSKYYINDAEADEIRQIYQWYAFGMDSSPKPLTLVAITRECIERGFSNYLHSKRNVNKCLKEHAYIGKKETHNLSKNSDYWNYKKKDAPKYVPSKSYICTYPAIFKTDDEIALFERVQERLKENNPKYTKYGENYLDRSSKHTTILAKLIQCPECGSYLVGEYRLRINNHSPQSGKLPYHTYRCNYSRSAVHVCCFRRALSLPLVDSVIWAYCKRAAFQVMRSEANQDVKERVSELDEKIINLSVKIQEFDIQKRINAEDAILRAKTTMLKEPSLIENAIKEYNKKVGDIDKELGALRQRKLDLENERENIKNSVSLIDRINQTKNITSNKKLMYKYLHKVVDYIQIVAYGDGFYVFKVHFKQTTPFYKNNEYICVFPKTKKRIFALLVYSYNSALKDAAVQALQEVNLNIGDTAEAAYKKHFLDNLPSTDKLYWDNKEGKFRVYDYSFTPEEMKDYYEHPTPIINPLNPRIGASLIGAPVHIKLLEVERLTCYQEDNVE